MESLNNSEIVNRAHEILKKIEAKIHSAQESSINKDSIQFLNSVDKSSQSSNASILNNLNVVLEALPKTLLCLNKSENIKQQIIESKLKTIIHNYNSVESITTLDNIAIILSFYGLDAKRISATSKALSIMLLSSYRPQDWIFVEALTDKNLAVFRWLKEYGIHYVFKQIPKESDGIFLKTVLWNIGTKNTKAEKLCFIDSDIVFCNHSWLSSVLSAFEHYDVLSLAGYVYYEDSERYQCIVETLGHKLMHENLANGHCGFSLGMTRKAYNLYGQFEAFNMHDDIWIWHKILGSDVYPKHEGWTPYEIPESMKFGLPLRVGSTEEVCCHANHGNKQLGVYDIYGYVSNMCTSKPFEDIIYDKITFPVWSKPIGQIVKLAFLKISKLTNATENHHSLAFKILNSAINEIPEANSTLYVIVTAFSPSYRYLTLDCLIDHIAKIELHCKSLYTQLSIVPQEFCQQLEANGIDAIPFSSEKVQNDSSLWEKELNRLDISIPDNAKLIYIPINLEITTDFIILNDKIIM